METTKPILPCLMFNFNAQEALEFYGTIFKDFSVSQKSFYGKNAPAPEGTLLTAVMTINGSDIMVLNGGPSQPQFNEAVSLVIQCDNQQQVDYYWDKLLAGGGSEMMCAWLQDRFGLRWQVVPVQLMKLIQDPDPEKAARAMNAMMQMVKIDIAKIEEAVNGN